MRRRWTACEITTVVARYSKEGPKLLSKELGRTLNSISSQARRYGQKTPRRSYQRIHDTISFEELIGESCKNTAVRQLCL